MCNKVNLLLLSCGTNACFHIAKILKFKFSGDFYVVGCDINKRWLIPTSDYIDAFYQCPISSDENYYSFIIDICKKEKIDWILPSFDNDQFLFPCDNQDLLHLGIKSFSISSALDFYRDKELTNNYLESIGIPVPKHFSTDEVIDETDYFIKPIHGVGSIGICRKKGKEIKKSDNPNVVIQELCFEPEYTLECFLYDNRIYSVVRERIASKSGVCTKTRIFQDKCLESYAYKLASKTSLPHIFNMQFMKNSLGEYVCTDLNLRTAGGMSLSYTAGWDEVSCLANLMLGKDEKKIVEGVDKTISEQYIVRHYEDIVTKRVKNHIAFDLDGTLLDSRRRHEIVMLDVLAKNGLEIDTSGLVEFKSNGKNNLDWLLAVGVEAEMAKKYNSEWINLIENPNYLKIDSLFPNVIDILERLSEENDLFLITARNNKEYAIQQIKNLGIYQFFTDVIVVNACSETSVLKSVELKKNKITHFIGDTESDYKAAMIANCRFSAVSYGFRNEVFLKKITNEVYHNLQNIIDYV